MSHAELVVLALISRSPRHGYEIYQDLESMRVQSWARVARSTVYKVLQRLEERGQLERSVEREGNRPERHVYGITDAGRSRLAELARKALASPEPAYSDRVVGAALAGLALERPRDVLSDALERVEAALSRMDEVERGSVSERGRELLRFARSVAEAERRLLAAELKRLGGREAGEGLPRVPDLGEEG